MMFGLSTIVGDLLLIAGDDAFRLAGSYYATVRDGARRQIPEAVQVFQMLQLFWRRRRRATEELSGRSTGGPTLPTELFGRDTTELFGRSTDIERDFKRLIHGEADGTVLFDRSTDVIAKHESPTPPVLRPNNAAGGVHEVIDNVHR